MREIMISFELARELKAAGFTQSISQDHYVPILDRGEPFDDSGTGGNAVAPRNPS
jgi:hypothetical protein